GRLAPRNKKTRGLIHRFALAAPRRVPQARNDESRLDVQGAKMQITAVHAEPIFGQVQRDLAIISSLTFLTPDGGHMKGNYVLVRISDDAGRVGLGEASVTSVWSGETQAGTIALIKEELASLLIGADPFDLEWISHRMDRAIFANSFAKGAVEMALL